MSYCDYGAHPCSWDEQTAETYTQSLFLGVRLPRKWSRIALIWDKIIKISWPVSTHHLDEIEVVDRRPRTPRSSVSCRRGSAVIQLPPVAVEKHRERFVVIETWNGDGDRTRVYRRYIRSSSILPCTESINSGTFGLRQWFIFIIFVEPRTEIRRRTSCFVHNTERFDSDQDIEDCHDMQSSTSIMESLQFHILCLTR